MFAAGMFFARKDLGDYMREAFSEEIDLEIRKNEAYRNLEPPPAPSPAADLLPAGLEPRSSSPAISPLSPIRPLEYS